MKTYAQETQSLLRSVLSISVYADVVPETVGLPAVAWYNIGYQNARILNGTRTPTVITQRIMIVVDVTKAGDLDLILGELDVLDNTSNDDFQRIELVMNNVEPVQPESPVMRAMVDLTLTV